MKPLDYSTPHPSLAHKTSTLQPPPPPPNDDSIRFTDVLIIGAGTAGLAAWRCLQKNSVHAVMIDKQPHIHTTCASVGCMPSKLLIAAAAAKQGAQRALSLFGSISAFHPLPNDSMLWNRIHSERDRFTHLVAQAAPSSTPDISQIPPRQPASAVVLQTTAQLLSYLPSDPYPFYFALHQHQTTIFLKSKKLIQASGSQPNIPLQWTPFLSHLGQTLHTNESIFNLHTTPQSIAVIGSGVIGLELGCAFHNLGTTTHIISHTPPTQLLKLSEQNSALLANLLDAQGIHLHLSQFVKNIDFKNSQWHLTLHSNQIISVDHVLLATGRKPNILPDTDHLPSTHHLIIGDASAQHPLLHEAAIDGTHTFHWYQNSPPPPRPVALSITFSYPQVAIIGSAPTDAGVAPLPPPTGIADMSDQGRSRVDANNQGSISLWFHPSTLKLSYAEVIHPNAEHIAHLLAWAIQAQQTLPQLLAMPFFHPTIFEGLRTALRNAADHLSVPYLR